MEMRGGELYIILYLYTRINMYMKGVLMAFSLAIMTSLIIGHAVSEK